MCVPHVVLKFGLFSSGQPIIIKAYCILDSTYMTKFYVYAQNSNIFRLLLIVMKRVKLFSFWHEGISKVKNSFSFIFQRNGFGLELESAWHIYIYICCSEYGKSVSMHTPWLICITPC